VEVFILKTSDSGTSDSGQSSMLTVKTTKSLGSVVVSTISDLILKKSAVRKGNWARNL
jgi:hypothetical protein